MNGNHLADLAFPMSMRNELVKSRRVTTHHVLPQSGWVSYWIKDKDDIPAVIELFKLQYQRLKPKSSKEEESQSTI
jgi:hypothetical protein